MDETPDLDGRAARLAAVVREHGLTVATAESLTSGAVASALGRAEGASDWFAGGVVAYSTAVKQRVLGVAAEQVVTQEAAIDMARGAATLLGADLAVSVTGVGGPGSEEGQPAGTVWVGVWSDRNGGRAELQHFDGDPAQVVQSTTAAALALALAEADQLAGLAPSPSGQVS